MSRLRWLRHASFVYEGSVRIGFDPWAGHPLGFAPQIRRGPRAITLHRPADLVLVTHGHYDHCDPEAVRRIVKDGTTIVAAEACASQLNGNVRGIKPGEFLRIGDVTITATFAYNVTKPFHPRGKGVGFLVAVDEGTIFHAGDTDDILETHGLKPDVALLPVGGTYTMDVAEAERAAKAIGASVAVPMHFGYIVGSPADGQRFVEKLGPAGRLLQPVIPFTR